MFQTAYLEIHEKAYKKLRSECRDSWSDPDDISERLEILGNHLSKSKTDLINCSILVLGCGDGELALRLSEQGAAVTGIDISPTAIEWSNEKKSERRLQATFVVGSVLSLPFEEATFDLVLDDHCFHCIIGDDRKKFLSEAKRVLKPKATLFIRTMCGDMPVSAPPELRKMFDPVSRCQVHNGLAGRYYGLEGSIQDEISTELEIDSLKVTKQKEDGDMLNVFAKKSSKV